VTTNRQRKEKEGKKREEKKRSEKDETMYNIDIDDTTPIKLDITDYWSLFIIFFFTKRISSTSISAFRGEHENQSTFSSACNETAGEIHFFLEVEVELAVEE
jgi:hypothetical protein